MFLPFCREKLTDSFKPYYYYCSHSSLPKPSPIFSAAYTAVQENHSLSFKKLRVTHLIQPHLFAAQRLAADPRSPLSQSQLPPLKFQIGNISSLFLLLVLSPNFQTGHRVWASLEL